MTHSVFVVSEWLPKAHCDQEAWERLKQLMQLTQQQEAGCVRAHATRQITHPGSPGKSKYTIILLQEYVNLEAFDLHCQAPYVLEFIEKYIQNPDTAIIQEGTCRLFSDRD